MNKNDNKLDVVDLELEQCHVRLFIPIPILLLWYLYWFASTPSAEAMAGLAGTIVFTIFALVHWAHVRGYPGYRPVRRIIAITADQTGCFVAMYLTGELGAIVIFLALWVSLGNGIRFGIEWMTLSAVLATTALVILWFVSDYWNQHPNWMVGLLLLNLAIPLYVARLIHGFHDGRVKLARYAEEMERLAMMDALTGLPNRTAFFSELRRASAHAQRTGSAIAVLYFDLDGFKLVNDTLGHTLGDLLLKETARRVSGELRQEDVLARLGGDEFVVMMQVEGYGERPRRVAERILAAIESIDSVNGYPVDLTASVGVAVANGREAARRGAERLVDQADLNMYASKRDRTSQIVLTYLTEDADLDVLTA